MTTPTLTSTDRALATFFDSIKDDPIRGSLLRLHPLLVASLDDDTTTISEALGGDTGAVAILKALVFEREAKNFRGIFPAISSSVLRDGIREVIANDKTYKETGKMPSTNSFLTAFHTGEDLALFNMLIPLTRNDSDRQTVVDVLANQDAPTESLRHLLFRRRCEEIDEAFLHLGDPRIVACFTTILQETKA